MAADCVPIESFGYLQVAAFLGHILLLSWILMVFWRSEVVGSG
jgi:hypothetical protein